MDNDEISIILLDLLGAPQKCEDITFMCDFYIGFIPGLEPYALVSNFCSRTCGLCNGNSSFKSYTINV
jgi:hypothetical protein